jgi:hypothetical protein
LVGETEVLGENQAHRRFLHHKFHFPEADANPGRRGGKLATNRFSYGTAKHYSCLRHHATFPKGHGFDSRLIFFFNRPNSSIRTVTGRALLFFLPLPNIQFYKESARSASHWLITLFHIFYSAEIKTNVITVWHSGIAAALELPS